MEKRDFIITGPGINITAHEGATDDTSVLLNELKGWDEDENIEIVTKPKLFGNGSFIVSERMGERTISATLFFGAEIAEEHVTDAWIRFNILSPFRQAAKNKAFLNLTRIYKDDAGMPAIQESIQGKIAKLPIATLMGDGSWQIGFEFLCPDPEITTTAA